MNGWSKYQMGWLLTLFDLPVGEKEARREATRFRKALLDEGFLMLQFSVYARACVSMDTMKREIQRLEKMAPKTGNIRILYITDQQWKKITVIFTPGYGNRDENAKMPNQIEFW